MTRGSCVVAVGLLDTLANDLELIRVYNNNSLYKLFDFSDEPASVTRSFYGQAVCASEALLKICQCSKGKTCDSLFALLCQITDRDLVAVKVYSDETHIEFPPVGCAGVDFMLRRSPASYTGSECPTVALRLAG